MSNYKEIFNYGIRKYKTPTNSCSTSCHQLFPPHSCDFLFLCEFIRNGHILTNVNDLQIDRKYKKRTMSYHKYNKKYKQKFVYFWQLSPYFSHYFFHIKNRLRFCHNEALNMQKTDSIQNRSYGDMVVLHWGKEKILHQEASTIHHKPFTGLFRSRSLLNVSRTGWCHAYCDRWDSIGDTLSTPSSWLWEFCPCPCWNFQREIFQFLSLWTHHSNRVSQCIN